VEHHALLSGSESVVQEAYTLLRNLNGNLQTFPLLERQRRPKFGLGVAVVAVVVDVVAVVVVVVVVVVGGA